VEVKLKALIFDMDGLMIDSESLYFETEREIAKKFDKIVDERVLWRMMGRKPIESMRIFVSELKLPLSADKALEMRTEIMREKMIKNLRSMPGLKHILNSFYGKLKLAVSTGAQREFLEIAIDKLGIRNMFDVLQASDEIVNGKPDPEIFLVTCRKLGLSPEICCVLEDSENGVIAGKRAGCYVIAVPSRYSQGQSFSLADFIASDLYQAERHIMRIIKKRNLKKRFQKDEEILKK